MYAMDRCEKVVKNCVRNFDMCNRHDIVDVHRGDNQVPAYYKRLLQSCMLLLGLEKSNQKYRTSQSNFTTAVLVPNLVALMCSCLAGRLRILQYTAHTSALIKAVTRVCFYDVL